MMGYKDRAWCSWYLSGECINANCERAFTAQDREDASNWWGSDSFPLIVADLLDTDKCHYIPKEMK